MRKLLHLSLFTFICLSISCSRVIPDNDELVNVPLVFSAVDISLSDELIQTRVSLVDPTYIVEVWEYNVDSKSYLPYGHGVYDNPAITIPLNTEKMYSIKCFIILNNFFDSYAIPGSGNTYYSSATNQFTLDSQQLNCFLNMTSFYGRNYYAAYYIEDKDSYFGGVYNYTPVKNTNCSIEMQRSIWGLKVSVDGLVSGSIKTSFSNKTITASAPSLNSLFLFDYFNSNGYGANEATLASGVASTITIKYYPESGGEKTIYSSGITMRPNHRLIYKIQIEESQGADSQIAFSFKNEEMIDDDEISITYTN